MPRKVLDVTRLHGLGWRHSIALEQGIADTYDWFLANVATVAPTARPGRPETVAPTTGPVL